ncbi:MAG: nucleotidyltransferase domain-containing protein [Deltaproteobacteria bacterium]|nr:nucleotidyltransferase domain-containing protein [Deltaproteobacteria bacterium]
MAIHLPDEIERIVTEAKNRLHDLYGDQLKDIILFGSYARGDYSHDSDLDLLLLLESPHDYNSEWARYLRLAGDLSLKYDTLVSIIPMDYATYQTRKTPLILNVRREGVRL